MIYGFTALEILLMGSAIGVFLFVLVLIVLSQQASKQDNSAPKGFDESLDDTPVEKTPAPKSMDMKVSSKPVTPAPMSPSTTEVEEEPITELLEKEEESPKKVDIKVTTETKAEVTEEETVVEEVKKEEVHVAVAGTEDLPDEKDVVPGQNLPINEGLVLWLDAFDPATLFQDSKGVVPVTRDNQTVGRLTDKSAEENHAVQLDTDNQPMYVEMSANGKPGLVFESGYLEGLRGFGAGKAFTVFFVGQNNSNKEAWPGVFTTKPSGSHDESGKQGFAVFGESESYAFKFEMGEVYLNDSDGEESHLSLIVGSDNDNNDSNKYVVGDWVSLDQPFNGVVSEIIVFDRELSDEERSAVITYLQTKWFVAE